MCMPVAIEMCTEIPKQICISVPVTNCIDVERQQCKQWPRESCQTVQVRFRLERDWLMLLSLIIIQESICRDVPVETCEQVPFTKCSEVPKEYCEDISFEECKQSPEEVCWNVPGSYTIKPWSRLWLILFINRGGLYQRAERDVWLFSSRKMFICSPNYLPSDW